MDAKEPAYSFSVMHNYIRSEKFEFHFPSNIKWSCTKCGICCGDTDNHERRVLLTEKDIKRIQKIGHNDFFDYAYKDIFVGVMKKKKGKCVFYGENGCKVYEQRALLCRMYPFWIERKDDVFFINVSEKCPGVNKGEMLIEDFFKELLCYALNQMNTNCTREVDYNK